MTNLKGLLLYNNQLTSLTLPKGLTNLERLGLSNNLLTSLILSPDTASSIGSLRLLISDNPFLEIRLPAGKDIVVVNSRSWTYNLVYYDPGDAPVDPVAPVDPADSLEIQVVRQDGVSETIEVYRGIFNLHLNNEELISITLPDGLTNLKSLDLESNDLRSLTLPEGLTSLQVLDLSGNRLTSLTLPDGLTSLEWLGLRYNNLASITLPDGLTSLETLDLSLNQLSGLTLPKGLTNLERLGLESNQLTSLTLPPDMANSIDSLLRLLIYDNPFLEIRLPAGMDIEVVNGSPWTHNLVYYDPGRRSCRSCRLA